MPSRNLTFAFTCFLFAASNSGAQTTVSRDQQAVTALTSSLAALMGVNVLTDVSLSGSAVYTVGPDAETGSARMDANSTSARATFTFAGGSLTELRKGAAGQWSGVDNATHSTALHNCWTTAAWFFPALLIQQAVKGTALSVTPDAASGVTASGGSIGVLVSTVLPGQSDDMTLEIQGLSAMHLELDGKTLLPASLSFETHPDEDMNQNIPVRIEFSDYRNVSGAQVAFHVQKFLQGVLSLDITLSTATLNPGLPGSEFDLQ